jgi:hypothetical protein
VADAEAAKPLCYYLRALLAYVELTMAPSFFRRTLRRSMPAFAGLLAVSAANAASAPDPLFQSAEVLNVRLTAPISTLLSERPIDEELPGTLQFTNSAGEDQQFDILVRTRGRFRHQESTCDFPPLRINFKKSQTKNTLFHKQDKLKLVTHCQVQTRYEQTLLREYLAYRILNLLTDASFRVRLLRITYVDNDGESDELTRYGVVIEHRDRLAKRLHEPVTDIQRTRIKNLDPSHTNLVSMFHYLIGNTDFSPIVAANGESCCHNHVLFGAEGTPYRSVPYDFDQSGIVDAPYATTNPRFKLRNVRQRLYRGRCINNDRLDATIGVFRDKHDAISALVSTEKTLKNAAQKKMTAYINNFYKTLASEKRVQAAFVKPCLK